MIMPYENPNFNKDLNTIYDIVKTLEDIKYLKK